eukprot:4640356-Pyramimonas_sp.AAC.1
MCWKDHYIDLILSYPSTPHIVFLRHGIGCYMTCQSHFRLGSGAGRTLVWSALALLILALPSATFVTDLYPAPQLHLHLRGSTQEQEATRE